ncbi:MAG: BatD family protein [Chthoniobacterales bacterium]
MNISKHLLVTGLALAALSAPAWAAQDSVTAQLQPQSIGLGDSAQLSVTVEGAQPGEPSIPEIDGLEIVPVGQQTSMQMINGAITSNVTLIYQVTPERVGNFTIPAITVTGAGRTQPIALRVENGSGGQSQTQRATSQSRAQLSPPTMNGNSSKNQPAFLRVVLPKQNLTVGELVPVQIKAYFRAGVSASLNGLPMLSSDAFALNKLDDQPEQTRESVKGVPYTVITWTSSLSAVKAGDYALNLDLPVMVRVAQERAPRRARSGNDPFGDFFGGNSPFDDPFFDNFFGQSTEKPMTLHTNGDVVKIKALPTQGRPADFSGAVGTFEITSEAASTQGATGDPLQLKISVIGSGNFSRVSSNGLTARAAWKTYDPSAQFTPADSGGLTGTKTFEQSIVPLQAGAQEIPAINFSYYDPEKETYVTKSTAPIPVQIAQNSAAPAVVATPAVATSAAPATTKPAADGLAPDEVVSPGATANLQPLVLRPWFLIFNAALFLALAVGAIFRTVRMRRAQDPHRLEREAAEKAVNESVATMDAAVAAKDAPRFFDAARHALQERLAARWQIAPSRVTIPEIRARLNGHGEEVTAVFKTADELAYSGKRFTAPDLQQWRDLVKTELQQLTRI